MPEPFEVDDGNGHHEDWLDNDDDDDDDDGDTDDFEQEAEYGQLQRPSSTQRTASSPPRTPMRLFQLLRQKRETSYSPLRQYEEGTSLHHTNTSTLEDTDRSDDLMAIQPLEILQEEADPHDWFFHIHSNPYFLLVLTVLFIQWPLLLILTLATVELLGRWWLALIFVTHALLTMTGAKGLLQLYDTRHYYHHSHDSDNYNYNYNNNNNNSQPKNSRHRHSWGFTLWNILDLMLWAVVYPWILRTFQHAFWMDDNDGSIVSEYAKHYHRANQIILTGYVVAGTRILLVWILPRIVVPPLRPQEEDEHQHVGGGVGLGRCRVSFLQHIRTILHWGVLGQTIMTIILLGICGVSALYTLRPSSTYEHKDHHPDASADCDYLDPTECLLPFPNYHYMNHDNGKTVRLLPQHLPLRSGSLNVDVWNELDGFSTAGPIMFYMDGMKEYHEFLRDGGTMHRTQLVTPKLLVQNSLNRYSTTLLIDVAERKLVQHTAEIDYLDPDRPMVLVFPGQPLKHASHYALAVVNATDVNGIPLPQSAGLKKLFSCGGSNCPDGRRLERFRHRVLPALEQAAPWVSLEDDPEGLQFLFDFPTISAKSQLGNIRTVRDKTWEIIQSWNWHDHMRVNRLVDNSCEGNENVIARTVHAELDVPWFLEDTERRDAAIHNTAVHGHNKHVPTGVAKFVLHIPCSVRARICENGDTLDIPAILEYGHGLFFNRREARFDYVMNMANDEGYLVAAMDWRGMSSYDLLVVIKTLIAEPSLARVIRDNLIQGYGNKLAMQQFLRMALWDTPWLDFNTTDSSTSCLRTGKPSRPIHAFYGNSQGGILGAGYTALMGKTGLLDRAILGVPGTPFAKIMTRSLDFSGYDKLLLMNFHNNRHVRIFLALVQMGWDSTEGSGLLAEPHSERIPPVLIQAGMGDAIVPTGAAESLARGFHAMKLWKSPRNIGGINQVYDGKALEPNQAVFTELKFDRELKELPYDDIFGTPTPVHSCLRHDPAIIDQIKHFVNTGKVLNLCTESEQTCVRPGIEWC